MAEKSEYLVAVVDGLPISAFGFGLNTSIQTEGKWKKGKRPTGDCPDFCVLYYYYYYYNIFLHNPFRQHNICLSRARNKGNRRGKKERWRKEGERWRKEGER